jgi:hypothetical protein
MANWVKLPNGKFAGSKGGGSGGGGGGSDGAKVRARVRLRKAVMRLREARADAKATGGKDDGTLARARRAVDTHRRIVARREGVGAHQGSDDQAPRGIR